MPKVRLITSDGKTVSLEENVARWSVKLDVLLEDFKVQVDYDGVRDYKPIPVGIRREEVLKKVIVWIQHHIDQNRTHDQVLGSVETAWDIQFLKQNAGILQELAEAAHELNIEALLYLCGNAKNLMFLAN